MHKKKTKPRGRHPHHRLTPISVRAKTAPGRYADGNGLYLVVDPSGAKRWIWRGRILGKRADLGLGGIAIRTLAQAREHATIIRRQARDGADPRAERRRASRVVPTFKAAATEVHTEHAKAFKNPKHRAQWLASLEADVFPAIGTRPINTITSGDVLAVLSPVWLVKPETARRLKQRMKVVFDWGKAKEFCSGSNPTEGIEKVLPKQKGEKTHHAALPYRDVPTFVQALQTTETISPSVRFSFEFLILTAMRTTEVQQATWDEIDFDAKTWTIPAARMKAARAHVVPLAPRAIEILEAARRERRPDSPYVFCGRKAGQPLSNMAFLKALPTLTSAKITAHGFRSSFRDWSAERTNAPREVCEAVLAHTIKDKVEAAYRRTDLLEKRRDLMTLWAQFATSTPGVVLSIGA